MEEYNFQLVEKINQQVHVVQVPDTCSFWMIRQSRVHTTANTFIMGISQLAGMQFFKVISHKIQKKNCVKQ